MPKRIDTRGYRKAYRRDRYVAAMRLLHEAKRESGCVVCGEADVACLDMHHRDPNLKKFRLSGCDCQSRSEKSVLAEMKKCTILCSNCHRKLHRDERDSLESMV